MAHTSMGVVRIDYDPLAEQLFEQAQNLQYPAPTAFSELGFLYNNQLWKRGDAAKRLTPKSRIIDLTPTEASQRVVSTPVVAPYKGVRVQCEIVVGTDGHVWSSLAKDAPAKDEVARIATQYAAELIFRPLRMGDEPVRFRTTVTVILENHGAWWSSYAQVP